MSLSDDIADRLTLQGVDLLRLEASTRRLVMTQIRLLERDLAAKIVSAEIASAKKLSTRNRRADKVIAFGRREIGRRYSAAVKLLKKEISEIAGFIQGESLDLLNNTLRVPLFREAGVGPLNRLLNFDSNDWWTNEKSITTRKFIQTIRQGLIRGDSSEELVKAFRGQRTGKAIQVQIQGKKSNIPEFSGGVFQASRNQARTQIQSAVQVAGNDPLWNLYQENKDILRAVQALAVLDARTSFICISRAGAAWSLEDGAPIENSAAQESFPGPSPWHFRCRTLLIPIPFSYAELENRLSGERLESLQGLSATAKRRMNGALAKDLDADTWLKQRGKAFARQKLGPGRFDLWEQGEISASQLIDQTGRPITVAELTG